MREVNFESYFDPDRHNPGADIPIEEITAELKKYDSGRWDYVEVCRTGKDGDLEPLGQQGFNIPSEGWGEDSVTIEMHTGKTIPGTGVCLNVPEEEEEQAIEEWLEQAQEVVSGAGFSGEWDGEGWYLHDKWGLTIDYVINEETGEIDAKATAFDVINAFDEAVRPWDEEMAYMNDILDVLSGWKKYDREKGEYVSVPPIEN